MKSTRDLLNVLEKIKDFSEFEKYLADIPNDKEKGDLFELFCQVYLKVIYKKQAFKSIQLFKDIDPTTLKRLNLRLGKDYGIDIVATTDSDDLWTIQVKFRQSDQLTWTELSTFRASSEKATFTIVMSNVSKVNHPHTALTNFSSILRNEFEALTEEDFLNIKSVLKGQSIKRTNFSPRPHQSEAIKVALNHFKSNNLGQMIHACGTGKTLTALWIKEKWKPKNTVVYVPSLALLKQTLEEWTKHKSSNFSIKCVCSDQSVSRSAQELDESVVDVTELGVPVTTNPKDIVEFLKSTDKDKVIFSTYQSSPVINEALNLFPSFSFDFGIFDEAHRTASKREHLFAKSLSTPVQKKLFMTATPKLYAPHLKSRAKEEDILLCSMDDSSIYGEVFHEIKFGEAIKLDLLSDYKIKIITVTNDEVKELIDRRYWLEILGKEITADELAKVWALLKSLNDTNHVISFHSRINGAKNFQSLVEKTVGLLKSRKKEVEDVKTYHISGEYPTYQRSKILSEFISQKKSLVTNARCLTEGVDVPAIDGVYFVDPKQNIIDIVQAVGRAIRKKPTKYGYIILPVFIKDETDTEKIIQSSAFSHVWNVVETMKDQDARLNHIIEELQELKGKKKFGSLKSREQSEERALKADLGNIFDLSDSILPKNIDIVDFVEKIGLKTLEIVGSSWDKNFGEYKAFKEKWRREPHHGPNRNKFERSISMWAGHQRDNYYKNKFISKEKINKLNGIGFVWDILDNRWNDSFNRYINFRKIHKKNPSNHSKDESEKFIAKWVGTQINNYKKNKLSRERIDKLVLAGLVFDSKEQQWENNFNNYIKFKREYSKEPSNHSKDKLEKALAAWTNAQRIKFKKGRIKKERLNLLNGINFIWGIKENEWSNLFERYKDFKIKYNREPSDKRDKNFETKLSTWVNTQRISYNKKTLPKERIKILESIGIIWDQKDYLWNQSFEEYQAFKKKYNQEPSSSLKKDKKEFKLGQWIVRQRLEYKKNELPRDRIEKLNSIGIIWDHPNVQWNKFFKEYKVFKEKYNQEPLQTSKVKSEKGLAIWAGHQRGNLRKNKLSKDRINKLNSIGFKWSMKS